MNSLCKWTWCVGIILIFLLCEKKQPHRQLRSTPFASSIQYSHAALFHSSAPFVHAEVAAHVPPICILEQPGLLVVLEQQRRQQLRGLQRHWASSKRPWSRLQCTCQQYHHCKGQNNKSKWIASIWSNKFITINGITHSSQNILQVLSWSDIFASIPSSTWSSSHWDGATKRIYGMWEATDIWQRIIESQSDAYKL